MEASSSENQLTKYYKPAIRRNMDIILGHLNTGEILPSLFSNFVLTKDEFEQLTYEGTSKGDSAQTKLLVGYILAKGNREVAEFVEFLKTDGSNGEIAKLIEETTKKMWSGEIRSDVMSLK